jgi:hypothetical protein
MCTPHALVHNSHNEKYCFVHIAENTEYEKMGIAISQNENYTKRVTKN